MINNTPLVSVVITTYNRCDKLKRAIDSVLSQTLGDLELIVVDNASTDKTGDIIKSVTDPRMRYIRHESNKGGPAARNTGINNARGPYIAFLDDDDQWFALKLEKQVNQFKKSQGNLGLVYVGTEIYDENKQEVTIVNKSHHRGQVHQQLLLGTILGSVSSVLVKKECFEKVGLFDEELRSCQDWDMWLRISAHFEFDYVDEILARINMHGAQISTNYAALIPGRTRMVQKHEEEFKQHPDIYVVHLKRVGKLHCINGTWPQALPWFQKAISRRPLELIKIMAWIIVEWPRVALFSGAKNFNRYKG